MDTIQRITENNIREIFGISKTHGFLSETPTPQSIRKPYDVFFNIATNLSELIKNHQIQNLVDNLPLINIDSTTTHEEHGMLYSMLCLIQAGYIWHNGEGWHNKAVPKQIAIPLNQVSNYFGIPPLLTHLAVDLVNWRKIDPTGPFDLENVTTPITVTADPSESHFYKVMIVIEYYGANILNAIIDLMYGKISVVDALETIDETLNKFIETIEQMRKGCDPDFFYNTLRIFLTGWTNETLFPEGMTLEGIDTNVKWSGGSAAQSSIIQVLDIFLGVTHQNGFLKEMRNYMPSKHREFLTWLEAQPNCRVFLTDQSKDLYNQCIGKLSKFRSIHMGLIHTYILSKAATSKSAIAKEGTGGTELAKSNNACEQPSESGLVVMLKEFRKETDDQKIN